MKILILSLAFCAFPALVCAQTVTCRVLAGENGVIASGGLAICDGMLFGDQYAIAQQPLDPPAELAGVRVALDGQPARLRSVAPDSIVIVVPPALRARPLSFEWTRMVITTPARTVKTWAAIADASPGVFEQNGSAQGLALVDGREIVVLGSEPVENRKTRIVLLCTGARNARYAAVQVNDALEVAAVEPYYRFAGLDAVSFDLSPELRGRVRVRVWANDRVSNEVSFEVIGPREVSNRPKIKR